MNKGSVLVCFGYHVQSTRSGIDDRSRYDAELRERGHAGAPLHSPWHCGDSCRRIDKTNLPKWLRVDARIVVCIKRINAVMLCGHIDHVMRSAARARVWEHSLACQEGEDDSLHQARCPGRSNKYGVPRRNPK